MPGYLYYQLKHIKNLLKNSKKQSGLITTNLVRFCHKLPFSHFFAVLIIHSLIFGNLSVCIFSIRSMIIPSLLSFSSLSFSSYSSTSLSFSSSSSYSSGFASFSYFSSFHPSSTFFSLFFSISLSFSYVLSI